MSDGSARLPLSTRARLYFTDLSFYTRSTLGVSEASKRQLWLVACYLAFGLGVFCRQVVNLSKFPSVDMEPANLRWSAFAASFIVGLAIFPFLVRYVRRLADYVSGREDAPAGAGDGGGAPEKEPSQGWNTIHVFTSFTTGFFVNLVYEKVLQIVQTQIR